MYELTDGCMNKKLISRMSVRVDAMLVEWIILCMDGWLYGSLDEWIDDWPYRWLMVGYAG